MNDKWQRIGSRQKSPKPPVLRERSSSKNSVLAIVGSLTMNDDNYHLAEKFVKHSYITQGKEGRRQKEKLVTKLLSQVCVFHPLSFHSEASLTLVGMILPLNFSCKSCR